ncbi:MAG: hypothetical protein ABIF85_05055 [Nanoarchaeota archaeon]|nr:hypothetical protein [Nanoarchaeota archaeon]MBU4452347.1 hypothetical protein [Nanoarchaeota archaeon]MCG2723376.1 hypothetical protein [archaeon]
MKENYFKKDTTITREELANIMVKIMGDARSAGLGSVNVRPMFLDLRHLKKPFRMIDIL